MSPSAQFNNVMEEDAINSAGNAASGQSSTEPEENPYVKMMATSPRQSSIPIREVIPPSSSQVAQNA